MRPWKTIRLWPDSTVFVIGGGPSLAEMDLSPIWNQRVIGVNDAFKLGNWVDVCWFSDCRWYEWNKELLKEFSGVIASCTNCSCNHPRVLQVKRLEGSGIVTNPAIVRWNKNSGASAINLAYHLGAKRIVLLGFDMKQKDGQNNWHQNHKHNPRPTIYQNLFLPPFDIIARDAKNLGIEILNATPDTDLKAFPIIQLGDVL